MAEKLKQFDPLKEDLINTGILATSFLVLFGVAEVLYHKLAVKAELTRKLVHFGTGILTLLFPVMLGNHWLVLFLCASFAAILLLSLKFNFLKSINAIDRESTGSLLYPISVYGCYLLFDYHEHNYLFFYIPILTLAICDPIAALMGKRWPLGKYNVGNGHKSMMGSGMFFISSFLLSSFLLYLLNIDITAVSSLAYVLSIATATCIAEAASGRGFDNLTIPLAALIVLELFIRIG